VKFKVLIINFVLFFSSFSSAQDMGNVGALVGWLSPWGNAEVAGRLAYGVDGNYMLNEEMGVGGYLMYSTHEKDTAWDTSFMPIGAEFNYYLNSMMPGLYAGANLGMIRTIVEKVNETSLLKDASAWNISFGGQTGYDYRITERFAVGGKAVFMYAMIGGGYNDSDDGLEFVNLKSSIMINLMLTGRYFF